MPATYSTMERLLRPVEPEARSRELTQAEKAQAFLEEQLAKITSKERARKLSMTAFGGARGDIQELRRFFSEADWPKAVKLIRDGMTPAAAIAALGYSATSMAGEKR